MVALEEKRISKVMLVYPEGNVRLHASIATRLNEYVEKMMSFIFCVFSCHDVDGGNGDPDGCSALRT